MKTEIFRNIAFVAIAAVMLATSAPSIVAQDNQGSTSTLTRRSGGDVSRKKQGEADGTPQVTQRMQAFYDNSDQSMTDADRQWMRVIYREIDLDNDKNAALYYPEDITEDQENLFRIIMRLLANGQIKAYEYLDGREIFNDENAVNVGDMLDRFSILHTEAKGSTAKAPRYTIHPSDVPTNEVLSYYIIEQWEFDTRQNKTKTTVTAICPVLHRDGDFGGDAIRYPMFWVKFSDIRPWLAQQNIFLSDENNLPTATYDDFFTLNMYTGDIYKTRNLKNKSMVQLYPNPDERRAAQDSLQQKLSSFDKNIWVPDREEVIASKGKSKKTKTAKAKTVAQSDDNADEDGDDDEAVVEEDKKPKRQTARSAKKPKQTKVKESKPKNTSNSNAARSVRRRK